VTDQIDSRLVRPGGGADVRVTARNSDIADLFDELADLLEIEDASTFRVRAYRNAARTIRDHPKEMADLIESGAKLAELPDIGKDLEEKIRTIVSNGKLPLLEEVASRTPRALSRLMKIEGLGPKRVKTLYKVLDIKSAEDLKRAVRNGRIREVPGFGPTLEQLIGERIGDLAVREARATLRSAERTARRLVDYLEKIEGVRDVAVAGSYRRRRETVGDLDILVSARSGAPVVERFVAFAEVATVTSKGQTRSTVRLKSGMQVDLRVVRQVSYGAALMYFTGSKAHNIAIRKLAIKKGYKINEYGVFKGEKRIAGKTEAEVYERLGLPFIEPELREDRGEIEAARKGRLPKLITLADLKGDLHCHTDASDGRHSLEQMAAAAAERGHEYISINDHSQHVTIANGLDERRLLEQIKAIDRLNEKRDDIVLLKSVELDILDDGKLDLPNRILKELDLTVCAVHYQFGLSQRRQTERILRAMDNRYFNILAHPTGRLINERAPYPLDIEKILKGAKERGCFLELDAQPDRLDLTDEACKLAKEIGVKIAISSDAHSTEQLDFLRFGIDQARRGWLSADDVINTRGLAELKVLLKRA
jgi:DNA polymerase (family 10)